MKSLEIGDPNRSVRNPSCSRVAGGKILTGSLVLPFSRLSPRRIKLFQNAPFTLMSVWWGAMREIGTGEPQICERAKKWHCKSIPTWAR
jgi:hypothetical protein